MSSEDCILFEHFVKLLHGISQVQPRRGDAPRSVAGKVPKSLDLVNQWFARTRQHYHVLPPYTCKIFFRLFFPEEDVRRRYGLKETNLAKSLATDVFGLPLGTQGAGRALLQWSEYPDDVDKAKLGCLGVEVEKALTDRHSARQGKSPSLQRIDHLLDELASLSGFSNLRNLPPRPKCSRSAILRELYLNLDPSEAKFLTQIILKDLRPVLYPLADTHTTRALLDYKSNALHILTKYEVMNAWHPCMLRIYRARATLDEAACTVEALPSMQHIPLDQNAFSPILGVPVEVPKSQKGVKLSHALRFFQTADEIWSETKYDGERMQIHVDLSRPPLQQITIFSKSKRDSTQDRMGTHPIIRAALGLPSCSDDYLQYPALRERSNDMQTSCVTSSVILDAEMVSYSESKGDIDEFWRLRSLVESTACGVRGARYHNCRPLLYPSDTQDSMDSTHEKSQELMESLQSNASDNGTRHLMVVFFDVLFLNGSSLLHRAYHQRRQQLERIVSVIPGYASLSQRQCIRLSCGIPSAIRDLARVFSQHIADHQEGVVLKASTSTYNSRSLPWVKLKRDYIPGYGDTVDLVILGAGWNKDRARELRVAPETFTTFFVAALEDPVSGNDLAYSSPQFQILFVVEYGLDRDQLETLNFYIKTSEPYAFSEEMSTLPYRFKLPEGVIRPAFMFRHPLLGELFGAGFTKSAGAKYYSLRFPRLTKVWRIRERNWAEGSTLDDFQSIARLSIGCESSDEWACRNVNAMWGCDTNPGPNDPLRVAEATKQWYDKLLRLEGLAYNNMDWTYSPIMNNARCRSLSAKRKAAPADQRKPASKRQRLHTNKTAPRTLRALGSMTNILHRDVGDQGLRQAGVPLATHSSTSLVLSRGQEGKRAVDTLLPTQPTSPNRLYPTSALATSLGSQMNAVQPQTLPTLSEEIRNTCPVQPSSPAFLPVNPIVSSSAISSAGDHPHEKNKSAVCTEFPNPYWPQHYINTAIVQFIQDAYVWFATDPNNKRPVNRPPALYLIPQNRRIGVIYYLLIICGCRVEVGNVVYLRSPEQFTHVNKCVMFVKTGDEPKMKEGLDWLFHALESWRTELNKPGNKELFVFDSEMISHGSLATFRGDVTSQALWRSSRYVA